MELLNFYFNNVNKSFYVRELVKLTGMQLNSIRRELDNLVKFGILMEDKEYKPAINSFSNKKFNLPIKRKYYKLNNNFVLYKEIETLMLKSKLLLENKLIEKLNELGKIKNLILTGIFIGLKDSSIDILIIGEVDRHKLKDILHKFGTFINKDLNYAVLSEEDYKYRLNIKDKFLFDILDKEKIEIKN